MSSHAGWPHPAPGPGRDGEARAVCGPDGGRHWEKCGRTWPMRCCSLVSISGTLAAFQASRSTIATPSADRGKASAVRMFSRLRASSAARSASCLLDAAMPLSWVTVPCEARQITLCGVIAGQKHKTGRGSAQVLPQHLRPAGVPELGQGLGLDLADALAGDAELLAHFLQRPGMAVHQAEPELDDLLLARGQGIQDLLQLILEHDEGCGLDGHHGVRVLDEVPEVGVFLADGRLQ